MTDSRRGLVSIWGVDIRIDPSWFVIFALVSAGLAIGYFPSLHPGHGGALYWGVALVVSLLFFVSVLLHELAHATVSNRLGIEVRTITLFLFGGVAHLSAEPRDPRADLTIALAGPAASLALGVFFALAGAALGSTGMELWASGIRYLAVANFALALFNSLPGLPLDGGRVARAIFWKRSGDFRSATIRASQWGSAIANGIIALGVVQALLANLFGGLWLVLIGMFLHGAAEANRKAALVDRSLARTRVADHMVREPIVVEAGVSVAEAAEEYFLHHGFGGFPVVDEGRAVGIVSLADVRRCPRGERARRCVREIMRPLEPALRISPDKTLNEALRQLNEADAGRLLVMEGDQLLGLVTRSGIARVAQFRVLLLDEAA